MDRIVERLRAERSTRFHGGLYHKTQVKLTYNSNRIEGSRLSEDQTRYIFETKTIHTSGDEVVHVDDVMETRNHFVLFDWMLSHADEPLSEESIKMMHHLLKRGTSDEENGFNVGEYKSRPNMVGDLETTDPKHVSKEIRKLLDSYHQKKQIVFEDIIDFHYRFECIHPFQDGNGRVGRIIMFMECLKHNIMPFIIDYNHQQFYYRGLREYANETGFLLDTCRSSQDRYESWVNYFYPNQPSSEQVD